MNAQNTNRRVLRGVLSGGCLTFVAIIVFIFQTRFAVVYLPTELVGVWMLILTFASFIYFADLGFSPTLSREIAFVKGRTEGQEQRQEIADLIGTTKIVFVALAVLTIFLGGYFGLIFMWSVTAIEYRVQIGWSWLIFITGVGTSIASSSLFASLYGLGDVATERILKTFAQLVWLVLGYVFLKLGLGLIGFVVAWTAHILLLRGAAFLVIRYRYPWLSTTLGVPSVLIFSKLLGPSMRWAIMGLGSIFILYSANIVIAIKLGPSAIPTYEAVTRIVMVLVTLSLYTVSSSTPFIAAAYTSSDSSSFMSLTIRNMRAAMFIIGVLSAYIGIYCEDIISIWLGPQFFPGWNVVWTLLIMVILETHHAIFAATTMATGRVIFAHTAIIAGVTNIILAWILIDILGLWGVALAAMFAQILTNNWYAPYATFRLFNVPKAIYLRQVVLMFALVFGCSLFINFVARDWIKHIDFSGLFLSVIIAIVTTILLAFIFALTTQERRQIKKIYMLKRKI